MNQTTTTEQRIDNALSYLFDKLYREYDCSNDFMQPVLALRDEFVWNYEFPKCWNAKSCGCDDCEAAKFFHVDFADCRHWFRLSASGYLDCTEWIPIETFNDLRRAFDEYCSKY